MATGFMQRFKGKIKAAELWLDANDALTATAGGGQANALPLTRQINRVSTVVTTGDSVLLPASSSGLVVVVINDATNACQVFGAGTDTINDIAYATGIPLLGGSAAAFICAGTGKWYSIGLGAAAAAYFSNVTLTGLMYESAANNITAHAGGGQASAFALTAELNRVSTVATANDSVKLPASGPGLTIIVENASANPMQVFGAGTDTINGVATVTGVSQMAGSVVIYTCYAAGAWFANGLGTGYAGSLETQSSTTGITAHAGGGQGSATALTTMMNNVTTVATAGDSVVLPASAVGLQIAVANNGAASLNVFCPSGSTMNGTSNGSAALAVGSVGIYFCVTATSWISK